MNFSRRDFCKVFAAGFALESMAGCKGVCPCAGKQPKTAVQLYSVRKLCAEDLPGTLKKLKEMGYAGVEFAGYYGRSATDMKKLLDDNGLLAAGTHINANSLVPEKIKELLDYAAGVGNTHIVCPGGGFLQDTYDNLMKMAERFSKAAEIAKPYGIKIGYHNHKSEFVRKFDGKCAWEIFFDATTKDVYTQLDIGHCHAGGEDPVFWLNRFPGRALTVHVKEDYRGAPSGILGDITAPEKGSGVPWDKVWPCLKANGCEWYVVECESNPAVLTGVEGCIKYMKAQGEA